MRFSLLIGIVIVHGLLLFAPGPAMSQTWNFQVVDDGGTVGYHSQIAVTSDGSPHILYEDATGRLKLASWISTGPGEGGWTIRQIDSGLSISFSFEIVADSNDLLHMAWSTSSGTNINYAVFDPGTETFVIAEEHIIAEYGSVDLALYESAGTVTPYVSWIPSSYVVKVAWRDPGSGIWTIEVAYDNTTASAAPSIAIDSNGDAHLSFYESAGQNLMYVTNANVSGTWIAEYVDIAGNVGTYSSIVIDAGDVPYIVYYDATNGDLKYAKLVTP